MTEDGVVVSPKGVLLRLGTSPTGYWRFSVGGPNRGDLGVHRLAALQWFGKIILEAGVQVRHLNGNPKDNRKENLSFGSQSDNQLDIPLEVRMERAFKGASKTRKLSPAQVEELRRERRNGASYRQLRDKFGIGKTTAAYICNGRTYRTV